MNNSTTGKSATEQPDQKPDVKRGLTRWVIRESMGIMFVGVALFLPAWSLKWVWGWAYVGVVALWVASTALILIPRCPELLIDRAQRSHEGIKNWDTVIMGIVGVLELAKYIVAGFDVRLGWTEQILGQFPALAQIAGLVIAVLGYGLGIWAMAENAFFSMLIRIQEERGHTVATGGPYRYVRHPGYVGTILTSLAVGFALGSLWTIILGVVAAALMVARTALEDKTLLEELDGYKEYAQKTRFRLMPGIW